MELIQHYLYITSSIPENDILNDSFEIMMRDLKWSDASRASNKYKILAKRFEINDNWYRVIVRFEKKEDETYQITTPIPFIVAKTEKVEEGTFVDTKVYHGRRMKSAMGYVEKGIPIQLIDSVTLDLRISLKYKE